MGRAKLDMKYREDGRARRTTYGARVKGMKKKARELSVLCGGDVLFAAFSPELNQFHSWPEQDSSDFQRISRRFLSLPQISVASEDPPTQQEDEMEALDLKLKEVRERLCLPQNPPPAAAAASDQERMASEDQPSPNDFSAFSPVSVLPCSSSAEMPQSGCSSHLPFENPSISSPPRDLLHQQPSPDTYCSPVASVVLESFAEMPPMPGNACSSSLPSSIVENQASHSFDADGDLRCAFVSDLPSSFLSSTQMWSPMSNWNDFCDISYYG